MVRIEVQQVENNNNRQPPTTTFVRRSSTPLIKTICVNCGNNSNQKEISQSSSSFFKWEQKLGRPIIYQVIKSTDNSIYTPIGHEIPSWNNRRRESGETRGRFQERNKFHNLWSGADLFLDPAIMGIKRGAGQLPLAPQQQQVGHSHNGLEFIKNFLRHRQCSFIEAHMKDTAQHQQQRRVIYGGH